MRRTPLRRKTPLRAKTGMKRTPLKQRSVKRSAEERRYKTLKRIFLSDHPMCEAHQQLVGNSDRQATDVHHVRGRANSLLCDTRYWLALCRSCHDFIHAFPAKARSFNLLASAADWNSA